MLRDGTTDFYEADALGSITSLTDASGRLVQTYAFDSFGNQIESSGTTTNSFQYTGREFDAETGLYYYHARYYNPSIGRFISEDPINFDGGINFYAYVGNSPTNFIDPFGLAQCTYQIAAHTLLCVSDHNPRIGPPYAVQVGPEGVASGGSMQGPTSCTNNNNCLKNRFEGPVVPGRYKMNYDTRPVHQGMDVYRLQPWPHHWYDGLSYDLHLSRGGFELHLGTISLGCINVDKRNPAAAQQYHQMNQLLRSEDGSNYLTVVP
jgi:RHS repeat-associated protein